MPNRILREGIVSSERVCSLSWAEEVFYRRLHSVVDDFGRYYAKAALLRAACYPLQLDKTSDSDIAKWLAASQGAGLVRLYSVENKEYLELVDFKQQVRAKASKFPAPTADALQVLSRRTAPAHVVVVGVEVGVEDEKNIVGLAPDAIRPEKNGHDAIATRAFRAQAVEILKFLNEKAGKSYQAVATNVDLIVARLREGATPDDMRSVIAKKCREWKGKEDVDRYLRPATLFGPKTFWQKYQGELTPAEAP